MGGTEIRFLYFDNYGTVLSSYSLVTLHDSQVVCLHSSEVICKTKLIVIPSSLYSMLK